MLSRRRGFGRSTLIYVTCYGGTATTYGVREFEYYSNLGDFTFTATILYCTPYVRSNVHHLLNHLGHVLEDTLDLQDLVEIRLHSVAPVHHLVAVASDLEALAGLGETNHGNIRQPHLRSKVKSAQPDHQ